MRRIHVFDMVFAKGYKHYEMAHPVSQDYVCYGWCRSPFQGFKRAFYSACGHSHFFSSFNDPHNVGTSPVCGGHFPDPGQGNMKSMAGCDGSQACRTTVSLVMLADFFDLFHD
jgi:hypothetical protein